MGKFTEKLLRRRTAEREEQDRIDALHFPRKEPCHDCAFRPGSPERENPKVWARLVALTDPSKGIRPFHCHYAHDGTEMPTDEHGNYDPPLRDDGSPLGFPICAGWARTFDVKLSRLRGERVCSAGSDD